MNTAGSLYKRGEIWYLRFEHRGREYRLSSGTTDREVAREVLKQRISDVVSGRLMERRADAVTFADLVTLIEQDYVNQGRRSLPTLQFRLRRLKAAFGNSRAVDITHKRLLAYVARRRREGASQATIRYELVALGRMFTLAVQAEMLTSKPPLPTVTVRNTRQGFFETEELVRVLEHLPEDLRPAIEFAAITGCRIGEIRSLTWAQVDTQARVVRLEPGTTKNDAGRTWPFALHPRLHALLVSQLESRVAWARERGRLIPWVFHRDGQQLSEFKKAWKTACRLAGCPGRLVHDLRRTAVRNLVRAGVTEHVAMALTGHRTRSVFDRYDIVNENDLKAAVEKLAGSSQHTSRHSGRGH